MNAIVDPDTCIGCELCTQICPEVYQMRGEKAYAYNNPVPAQYMDNAQDAADQCPVDAIRIEG